jgi:hypothetical protein
MKKLLFGVTLCIMSLSFAGCAKNASAPVPSPSPVADSSEKVGTTTKSGKVSKVGNSFLLQSGNQSIGLDSYSIDLSAYVDQQVTVSGQYSGDTLFVTTVQ